MLKHIIADKAGTPVEVNEDVGEDVGLVVAIRPHKTFVPATLFFTNDTYGREMAQNGKHGGAPLLIHDGTDAAAWTFSEPVGTKWIADNTDQFHAGAKSLLCDNPNVNDIVQVINNLGPGNDIDMTGNYVALTTWIRVDSDWETGDSFSLYAHLNGAMVGNKVNLEDYFPHDDYDVWHYVDIPLTDLGIDSLSIDAFRIENEARASAKSPTFWIDEWNLQESGAPIEFIVEPEKGTWLYVRSYHTTFVDAYNADNADSTVPHLSYEKILGMTPTVGYKYERYAKGESDPIFTARVTSLLDLLSYARSRLINHASDGTNTLITVEQDQPEEFILKAEDLDKMVMTIEDDFSALLFFRICIQGNVETR